MSQEQPVETKMDPSSKTVTMATANVPSGSVIAPASANKVDPGKVAGIQASMSQDQHRLTSTRRGESSVEKLAKKVEERRENRIKIPFYIRKMFLLTCRDIANEEGYLNKISVTALIGLRDAQKQKVENKPSTINGSAAFCGRLLGYWDDDVTMLQLFEAAVETCNELESAWFFFRDFSFYNTQLSPKFGFVGNPLLLSCMILFLFYFGSAILFCPIMKDDSACPNRDSYDGWLTAVYFASVTMSTVGYGDVNLSGGDPWRTFIGLVYMIVAMVIAYTVFSTAADAALSTAQISGGDGGSILLKPFVGAADDPNLPLYQRVRRITLLRAVELIIWFVILNLLGMFVARYFINRSDLEGEQWDWMTTFYWAVQTTTTIGYGDLNMPFDMRWFQIFFTTFGTAFVGAVFGAFAGLKEEVSNIRRFYAWQRREISKQLIDEMQGDADDRVDQYEFVLGSLLMLNKINHSDVCEIMDKYRSLSGEKGYILLSDVQQQADAKVGEAGVGTTVEEEEDMHMAVDAGDS